MAEMRHGEGCRFRGMVVGREASLGHEYCICDPHGTKHRALVLAVEKDRRRSVLWQDEVWFDKSGSEFRLEDLSLRWKRNILAFLDARAPMLQASWLARTCLGPQPSGEAATDAFDQMLDEAMSESPTKWLYQTPLVERLEHLIRIGQDGPLDRASDAIS